MFGRKIKFIRKLSRPQSTFRMFVVVRGGFEFWLYRGGPAIYVWVPPQEKSELERLKDIIKHQSRRVRNYSDPEQVFDAIPMRAFGDEISDK